MGQATDRLVRSQGHMPWLPGVILHPNAPRTLIVNRRYARWRTLKIFHSLGSRRVETEEQQLIFGRR